MLGVILAAVVLILVIVLLITGYKKAPPDTAYIISGLRKKIIIGKASIKIPFLERMDTLSLKLIAIDVKTSNAVPTADYINIQVDAAVNIKISSEPARLALAAENFLNQNTQVCVQVVHLFIYWMRYVYLYMVQKCQLIRLQPLQHPTIRPCL